MRPSRAMLPTRPVFASFPATMPTYDYSCLKCGHAFELVQSMTEQPIKTCPKELCPKKRWGKGKVQRGIGTGAGLIFKGSGFYITDYRSEGYKEAAKKDSQASSTSSDSGKSSSDAKPAKTEVKPAKPAAKSDSK